jgi:sensor domain CHASE-containing protein
MIGKQKEKWIELCELAAKEQDANKLIALVREINRLLEVKQQRLDNISSPNSKWNDSSV